MNHTKDICHNLDVYVTEAGYYCQSCGAWEAGRIDITVVDNDYIAGYTQGIYDHMLQSRSDDPYYIATIEDLLYTAEEQGHSQKWLRGYEEGYKEGYYEYC